MTRKPTRNEFIAGTGALAWVVRFFFPRCTLTSSTVSSTPQGEVQQNIGGIYRLPCVTATAIAAFLFLRIQGEQPADIPISDGKLIFLNGAALTRVHRPLLGFLLQPSIGPW